MRYVALVLILISLPVFINLLRQSPHRRAWAFMAIGLMLFFGDTWRIDGSIIAWPLWNGTARGLEFSPIDTLALALILTRRPMSGKLPFWGPICFYGVMLVLSLLPSSVPMATLFSCWQYGRAVLIFAAIGAEVHRPDLRGGLLTGLALGLMLQAGYVAQQKASGVVQATGTMFHQNALGMMTELAVIPLLAALLGGDRRKIVLAGVGAGLLVIAGGGSRGAMGIAGGGAVILLLLSLVRGMTPAKARVAGLAVLASVVAVPVGMWTLRDRFGGGSITVQDDQRPAFERAARAMANDYPIGVGANLYVPTANTQGYADKAGVAWNFANRSAPVHNAYLLARAETGWLGEIGFFLLLAAPLARALRFAFGRRQGMAGEVALGSAVALGVNIVHNNYEFAVFTYNVLALLFVNLGLAAAQLRAARLAPRPRRAPAAEDARPIAPGLALAGRRRG